MNSGRASSIASVTDSVARIEKLLPKVMENYKSSQQDIPVIPPTDESSNSKDDRTVRELREEIKLLNNEVEDLRSDNTELARALEELHGEYEKLVTGVAPEMDRLNEENESLNMQIESYREEIVRLQNDIEEIKASAVQAVTTLKSLSGNPRTQPQQAVGDTKTAQVSPMNRSTSKSPSKVPGGSQAFPSPVSLIVSGSTSPSRRMSMKVRQLQSVAVENATEVLSPVVEERLLYSVFDTYKAEASGFMPLSRLIRFSKEFGIIPGGKVDQTGPMLVAGDIDVLYKISLLVKTDAADGTKTTAGSSYHKHFLAQRRTPKAIHYAANSSMNVFQFIQVMRDAANKLYAGLIEQMTGTTLEYLAPAQREVASRAAMEMLIQKKILPVAGRMNLIPWPLLHLDRTICAIHESFEPFQALKLMSERIETWFLMYLSQTSSSTASSKGDIWGLSYKRISKFAHDVGMVPAILSEPQLYSIFDEILRWMKTDPELLWKALPQELSQLDLAQFEMHHWAAVSAKEDHGTASSKGSLGILAFSLLLATVATQVFSSVAIEHRLTELFEWFDKNDAINYDAIAAASAE